MAKAARDQEGVFEAQIAANVAAFRAKVRATGRPFKEWIGKTADAMPPPRIRERIRQLWDDRCFFSEIEFRGKPFVLEHLVRVKDGQLAANREGNIRPVLADAAIIKTAREKRDQASADRKKRKGAGTKAKPKKKIEGPGFDEAEPQRRASRPLAKPSLPPRPMYRSENI
jgi:5-methylcytosine-specific restriction protein A